ncbi:TsaE protein, required for threonylcarbamoyladenosine t(6)A37 formation in tRNA [hydrothermal vent metagenome]|uniref:tRNA threonylcarbamoyladenosine biosynthesis protein TsaE n=1 Tax=hydrothermal vent metagenome TaxID=652676 RepID=A0A1W1D2T4_9ZZZZ
MKQTYTLTLNEIDTIVDAILNTIKNGVVILKGDLASGKTTLVKKIVQKLQKNEEVTSPTFSLQQVYGENIFHYDLYNHGLNHFLSLGMLEELDKEGLHFIEWGDDDLVEILYSAGIDVISIEIKKIANDKREYTLCTH